MYKVLVVDDEIAICQGLTKLIETNTREFIVKDYAQDGKTALAKLQNSAYDLVITDVRMPGLDGIALVERLQGINFLGRIIILSAYPEFEYAQKAMLLGVKHYLIKPVNIEELKKTLELIALDLSSLDKRFSDNTFDEVANKIIDVAPEKRKRVCTASQAEILQYIDENYHKDITLTIIAKHFYMNPAYLGRVFKDSTGGNFNDYLANLRIGRAKELLRESTMLIYEICEAVGYHDLNYFYRVFKAKTGLTPSEFRNIF